MYTKEFLSNIPFFKDVEPITVLDSLSGVIVKWSYCKKLYDSICKIIN